MSLDELGWYLKTGRVLGGITAVIVFVAVYIAAIGSVGWVIGIALGWIPAGLAAVVSGGLVMFLWGPAALVLLILIFKLSGS